jgi:catechol 2,3-dioxygenase-like lactoylglutathione lyase family enzyme
MELPSGTCIALIEVKGAKPPQQSIWIPSFWPGNHLPPHSPEKLDHLAFDVATFDDLVWFHGHLRASGVAVSDVVRRSNPPRFVDSIYFNDPSGIPLEIATWDRADPMWAQQRPEDWFADRNPVPALME